MTNYLQPVNGPVRWLAIVALGLATLVLALLVIFLAALPLFAPNFKPKDTPILLGIVAFFGVFLVTCSWMFLRLLRGTPSSSGVTILPLWFIRVFGVLFMAGTIFAAWQSGVPLLGLEGCGVGLAMLLVGRSLERADLPW